MPTNAQRLAQVVLITLLSGTAYMVYQCPCENLVSCHQDEYNALLFASLFIGNAMAVGAF